MAFFSHHHLQQPQPPAQQQQQQQLGIPFRNFVPINGQISAPVDFSSAALADPTHHAVGRVMGLAPGAGTVVDGGSNGWEPMRKRIKEQDLLENSQISSIDFLHTGSVSTGLGLSLDDRRIAASSGESQLLLLPTFDQDINREMQRMDADMDQFIKLEGERLKKSIMEKLQMKQFQTLASLEEKIRRKVREKESEMDGINKRNAELEEQLKQLALEASTWQQRAKYNESLINSLKYNLEQLYAQRKDTKEGCGDSEVDDAASCCNGDMGLQLMLKQDNDMESKVCKVCGTNDICMLLLPCRHLCLCKECEGKLSFCPLCRASKLIGMEIYM
ncbi:probable BOI-related E3 ubiquitin-protein ligase 2 [Zingiber officinale]|uniref:probable BOI-related E3 ubiquitin-protein ligase 2 n=1 Tax=Zingiber officinale TaxID=94328 RepID=UPI001C4B7F59|nr:probable BOI-related E3 ubiquitin-protein ligase 2 [Zingiber officinale]